MLTRRVNRGEPPQSSSSLSPITSRARHERTNYPECDRIQKAPQGDLLQCNPISCNSRAGQTFLDREHDLATTMPFPGREKRGFIARQYRPFIRGYRLSAWTELQLFFP